MVKENWFCSYLHKDEPTGVRPNSFIHNQYENGECDWFICEEIYFEKPNKYSWKDVGLFFMLGIY